MIPLQPPRYEVINSRPSLRESIREFTLGEWATWAGVTTGSAIYGYAVGEKKAPPGSRSSRCRCGMTDSPLFVQRRRGGFGIRR